VFGIKLTRENRLGIMGLPLAARQALVRKRMTFSRLRWLKGATTTPQMWQLIV
jgi:hypothetical protein